MASLLHDDVIDNADTRRGLRALNTLFGNKVCLQCGAGACEHVERALSMLWGC